MSHTVVLNKTTKALLEEAGELEASIKRKNARLSIIKTQLREIATQTSSDEPVTLFSDHFKAVVSKPKVNTTFTKNGLMALYKKATKPNGVGVARLLEMAKFNLKLVRAAMGDDAIIRYTETTLGSRSVTITSKG